MKAIEITTVNSQSLNCPSSAHYVTLLVLVPCHPWCAHVTPFCIVTNAWPGMWQAGAQQICEVEQTLWPDHKYATSPGEFLSCISHKYIQLRNLHSET